MSSWKQVTLTTSVSSRYCLLFKVWGCRMLKPRVGQKTGHDLGARVNAVPTLTYFILLYSTGWVPHKVSKECCELIFSGPDCPRYTLGPLIHHRSARSQVCENDRSHTIHLLHSCVISTRFVVVTLLSVCCTVIEVVMMMMVVVDKNQDTSLLSWRWRLPVVPNIGTHWTDSSVICCCTVAILLCYVLLLLLCICVYIPYLLTPWSRVLLEKLTGSAASQEIPRIFGTRRFLTVLTSARHLSLS